MANSTSLISGQTVFERNLESLFKKQPALAKIFQNLSIKNVAELTTGRDGSRTYRWRDEQQKWRWLGFSSMPTISTPALLSEFSPGTANVLLPTMGHGGEAQYLLDYLSPHQAVFTWDAQPLIPAIALRLHDFSDAIGQGRLVISVGNSIANALVACFEDYPLHLPPQRIFIAPWLLPTELHAFQTQAESVAQTQLARLEQQLTQLRSCQTFHPASPTPTEKPTLAIVSQSSHPILSRLAEGLGRAAEASGRTVFIHLANRPDRVHGLSVAQLLTQNNISRIIFLDQLANELKEILPKKIPIASWLVTENLQRLEMPRHPANAQPIYRLSPWTSDPEKGDKATHREIPILGPAADPQIFYELSGNDESEKLDGGDVSVVLDAAIIDPEAMGAQWHYHIQFIDTLIKTVRRDPQRISFAEANAVVHDMSDRLKFKFDAPDARQGLIRYLSQGLAPTLTVIRLAELCKAAKINLKLWGNHWARYPETATLAVQASLTPQKRNSIYNSGAVILHLANHSLDELELVEAIAAGACVLRQQDRNSSAPRALPDLWKLVPAFSNVEDAIRKILETASQPALRRSLMTPARQEVLQHHLFSHRLHKLLQINTA